MVLAPGAAGTGSALAGGRRRQVARVAENLSGGLGGLLLYRLRRRGRLISRLLQLAVQALGGAARRRVLGRRRGGRRARTSATAVDGHDLYRRSARGLLVRVVADPPD